MPSALSEEISNNFKSFDNQWPKDLAAARTALAASSSAHYMASYLRITSIQAWRASVITQKLDEGSSAFFFEAQNDLLVSHCMAQCGSFRQALKSLRAAIENFYFSMYYKDHPIELQKWEAGQHKLGFTELSSYFESHPQVIDHGTEDTGLSAIKTEYATLSKAVHGSAKIFRMTQNLVDIKLWSSDAPGVGKWAARERAVIIGMNQLLLHLFKEELLGTKQPGLRELIGHVLPKAKHSHFKTALKITIPTT